MFAYCFIKNNVCFFGPSMVFHFFAQACTIMQALRCSSTPTSLLITGLFSQALAQFLSFAFYYHHFFSHSMEYLERTIDPLNFY